MEMFFSMAFRQVETHSVASRDGRGNRMRVKVPWMRGPRERVGPVSIDGAGTLNRKVAAGWQQRDTAPSKSWGLTRFLVEHKENARREQ
jgi:hypothetical protein